MKAILEFDLDELKDVENHARMLKATDLCTCLWDIDQWLRAQIRHGNKNEYEPVRDKLHELMNENGINLDQLYS